MDSLPPGDADRQRTALPFGLESIHGLPRSALGMLRCSAVKCARIRNLLSSSRIFSTRRGVCADRIARSNLTRPEIVGSERRITWPRSGPTGSRASSTLAGMSCVSRPSSGRRSSGSSPGTELTRRPDLFPAWDSLSDAEKKLYARQIEMEVFAGYSENADWNVGRLLDAIEEMATWITRSSSTSGAITAPAWRAPSPARSTRRCSSTAWCSTPPSRWPATWAGPGPMVVAWPGKIKAGGGMRTQFTHCIDIAPTVLEAVGVPEPATVDGIGQEPMDGTSFAYTFGDARAEERHTVQYFEIFAAVPCTRTAGGRAPGWTRPRGTSPQRRSRSSSPGV